MKKKAVLLLLGGLAALPFACGGKVGEALRPSDPTATHAMNADACMAGAASQPLVIDLSSAERTDLELAMRKGIMVVNYDCKSLHLVKGCQLEGSYAFAAVVPKEDLVTIKNADELLANMPISGAKFEAEIRAGSSIDLVLVTIGQRGATLLSAAKADLKGPECKEATHFVRAAYVGGFSMTKNTMGKAKIGAEGFGGAANAQSGSDKMAAAHDGDLDVCRGSSSESSKPPEKCQSPLRIEIVPITAERVVSEEHVHAQVASSASVAASVSAAASFAAATPSASASVKPPPPTANQCAAPMVWTGTMCAKQNDAPHLCDPKDEADCTAQCNAGHAGSCYALGQLSWKDPKKAIDLFDKACKGREARGCYAHANNLLSQRAASKDDAQKAELLAAAQKEADAACGYGDGWSCFAVSSWYQSGYTFPKDLAKSGALLKRSCDLGYSSGCTTLANVLITGNKDVPKDTVQAGVLLTRACESGSSFPCERLGQAYQKGELGAKDGTKAIAAYGKACDLGGARSCAFAGQMYKTADGVPADPAKAKELFEKGCTPKVAGWDACLALGETLEKTDKPKAAEAYARGCMLGGCARAAAIYEKGDGGAMKPDPVKALELYTRACNNDLAACDKAGALIEKTDKERAKAHYLQICTSRFDQPSCDTAKKMGATIPDTVKPHPRAPVPGVAPVPTTAVKKP